MAPRRSAGSKKKPEEDKQAHTVDSEADEEEQQPAPTRAKRTRQAKPTKAQEDGGTDEEEEEEEEEEQEEKGKKPARRKKPQTAGTEGASGDGTARAATKPRRSKPKAGEEEPAPFVSTGLWLMKNEPSELSMEILKGKPGQSMYWDGVRGYPARNHLRRMKIGDRALFYYSSCKVPGIAGIIKVVKEAYPDHTAWNPKSPYYDPKSDPDKPTWDMVDVQYVEELPRFLTLEELRRHKEGRLAGMQLFSHLRLSIQPLSQEHWDALVALAKEPAPADLKGK